MWTLKARPWFKWARELLLQVSCCVIVDCVCRLTTNPKTYQAQPSIQNWQGHLKNFIACFFLKRNSMMCGSRSHVRHWPQINLLCGTFFKVFVTLQDLHLTRSWSLWARKTVCRNRGGRSGKKETAKHSSQIYTHYQRWFVIKSLLKLLQEYCKKEEGGRFKPVPAFTGHGIGSYFHGPPGRHLVFFQRLNPLACVVHILLAINQS